MEYLPNAPSMCSRVLCGIMQCALFILCSVINHNSLVNCLQLVCNISVWCVSFVGSCNCYLDFSSNLADDF